VLTNVCGEKNKTLERGTNRAPRAPSSTGKKGGGKKTASQGRKQHGGIKTDVSRKIARFKMCEDRLA